MKKIFFLIPVILFLFFQLKAQNKASNLPQDTTLQTPQITFSEKSYDFGKIRKGEKFTTSFYFKNTGTRVLVLLQVQTSCGCTATNWSTTPIQPNETGEISVTFDTNQKEELIGKQNKVILVISNALNKEEKLNLIGEIVKVQ